MGPLLGNILMAGAAVTSTIGSLVESGGMAQQYEAKAAAADYNARVSTQTAYQEQGAAATEELLQRRRDRLALGEQAAGLSQSGADLSGSAGLSLTQSATNAEFDALNIRYGGAVRSRAHLAQADLDRMERDQAKKNANTARAGGFIGGATKAMTGAANYIKAGL